MPNGSMLKFFQDRGGPQTEHKGYLHWPGTADGFPFRGAVAPDLKQDEFQDIPLALDYHSERFLLWEPSEKFRFDKVMDHIVNGLYMQHKRIDRWSDEHCGLMVWLEWVQIYGETPSGQLGASENGNTVQAAAGSGPFGIPN